jgi:two-component system copper resistance phosphate regulon response regulator CusR
MIICPSRFPDRTGRPHSGLAAPTLQRRPDTQLQIHDLHLDLLAPGLTAGDRLELTAKEFALLSLLARHKGEILSKMMIAEQVWDMNFDSDANVVEVAIKRLRVK